MFPSVYVSLKIYYGKNSIDEQRGTYWSHKERPKSLCFIKVGTHLRSVTKGDEESPPTRDQNPIKECTYLSS